MQNVFQNRRPALDIVEKSKGQCKIIYDAVLRGERLGQREQEKIKKCYGLKQEIAALWRMKRVEAISIVIGDLGTVSNRTDTRIRNTCDIIMT